MENAHPVEPWELQAFADGELPAARGAEVAAAIAADPALGEELRALRALASDFDALSEALLALPVPERLRGAAAIPPPRDPAERTIRSVAILARHRGGWAAVALAASIALAVLLIGSPASRDPDRVALATPVIAAALDAREGQETPVETVSLPSVPVSEGDTGVAAVDRLVADVLGARVRVPDLRRLGFRLVAAERFGTGGDRALQFRYRDASGRLFAVYVHPGRGPDRFALLSRREVRICLWENEDVSTVMSGALPVSELFRLSSAVYTTMSL